jgi:hypothetical protein
MVPIDPQALSDSELDNLIDNHVGTTRSSPSFT